MKRKLFLIVIILTIFSSGLFAESKTIFEKSRGLSYLRFYENQERYFIYAEELKDVGQKTIIHVRGYDKQKLSDVVIALIDDNGMNGNFLNNIKELDSITFDKKETEFSETSPKIVVHYYYFVE